MVVHPQSAARAPRRPSASDRAPLLSAELLGKLEKLELVSRKIFRGRMKGERRSTRRGRSVEFADYRSYVAGDDLRFIDWNIYARLDRLFLRLFLEEEDLHFYTLIDASPSMTFGEPSKFDYARKLAAALGFIGLVRSDRICLETIGQPASRPGPVLRGRASLHRMLDHLQSIEPDERVSLAAGVKNFCLRHAGKGIIVLISDLMDKQGYEEALRYLVARQMDCYVVHVLAPEELDPDLQGDLALVDCEDGDVAEVTASAPLVKRYRETLAAFLSGAKNFCTRRGMSYLFAPTSIDVERLVSDYLRSRGLVR